MSGYRDLTSQNNANLNCKSLSMSGSTAPLILTHDPYHSFMIKIGSGGAILESTDKVSVPSIFSVTNTTTSSDTLTGAVQVAGGMGIQGAIRIGDVLNVSKSADPTVGKNGDVYFNTTSHKWVYCDGSSWIEM